MSLLCESCRFSGAAVEKTLALPQLQLVEKSDSFYGPSYWAVACSVFAFGVQVCGLFWEMTSGCFPYSALCGSTLDTCYVSLRRLLEEFHTFLSLVFQRNAWFDSGFLLMRQTTEAFTVHTAENCGFSAVAVPRRSSIFPVVVRRSIPMVLLFSRPSRFPSCSCTCGRCPWFAYRPGFPVVAQRRSPMVQTCSGPKCFPCCQTWWSMSLLHRSCSSSCRCAEAVSHGPDCCWTKRFTSCLIR